MAWPLSQEYNEAVQNPRTSFSDPDLRAGEVVTGPLGIPMPRSGNFADVYQVRGADGRMWALKRFTRPAAGLRERYLQIDAQLRTARLPFSVGFQFLPEGVRIRGLWFPALKMEWIEGLQLNQFVRENADKPEHLRALLGLWVRLCRRLREARIAHADLQHGNVLLVPGDSANTLKLRLIDYDGMWVPALASNPSGEAGHPAYQHPARLREKLYSSDVDRFPHLVIGCALRALAIAGRSFWNRFDNGDNMLFREADLADPGSSPLFKALWELDDPTVTNLVALLIVCATRPVADTPWLDEVLEGERAVPVSDAVLAHAAKVLGVTRRAARRPLAVANLYVVPEEANQFIEMGSWSRRRRGPSVPLLVGSGIALAAAIAITILVVALGGRGTNPADPASTLAAQATSEKAPATPVAKAGVIETKWANIEPGPPIRLTKGLVSGIDVAPPNSKTVRSYPLASASVLGVWPLPDGLHALVVSKTGIGVLDLDTGQLQPFTVPRGEMVHPTISPDRKYVVVAAKDHTVRCFDIAKGESRWSQKFRGSVGAVAITADGLRVAATAEKVGYIEWDLADGSEIRRHESLQATHLVFAPDGHFALASGDGGAELWALDDAKVTPLPGAFTSGPVAVSPDGKFAFAGVGSELKNWSLPDGKPVVERIAPAKNPITALAMSTDGTLLVGTQSGETALVGADTTFASFALGAETGAVVSFGVTGDGAHALVAGEKGSMALCRVADLVRSLGPSKTGPTAGCLEFARFARPTVDYKMFAVDALGDKFLAATESQIGIYDAGKFTVDDKFELKGGKIVAAGFGPEDKIVVCQAEEEKFVTRAFSTKKKLDGGPAFALPKNDPGRISRVSPVRDRPSVIATTEFAGDVLFDPATGLVVEGWPPPDAKKPRVATPSADGRYIAVGSARDPVQLWSSETANSVRDFEASSGVVALAFTPDGKRLVGLWPRGRVRVWAPETGKLIREVDHDYPGPFGELAAVTNEVVVLGTAPDRFLLSLETGKGLSVGDGPDPLHGRGPVIPSRGLILATDRDSRLTAWRVEPRQGASLAPKPPPRSSWPDVRILRDAPVEPPIGMGLSEYGRSLILASPTALSRYSVDRLILNGEVLADESPVQMMIPAHELFFTLGKKSVISIRDGKTLAYQDEVPAGISVKSTVSLFVVQPQATHLVLFADKLRVFDVKSKKETTFAKIPTAATGRPLTQFAYSGDGDVGVGRWGNAVTAIWHPKMTEAAKVLQELKSPMPASQNALALSGDGKFAVLGTGDGKITIWDTTSAKLVHDEDVYPPATTGDAVTAVAMIPGTTHFVTAGRNGRVIVWNLQGFKKVKELVGPDGPWRILVAPDGRAVYMLQPGIMQVIDLPRLPRS